ncbi:MAG: hypothetical protein KAR45_04640 [Desulfobacteraceae bacterium]|nr:hypothetical protein [Desulfobacteraceae bacterium]
MIILKDLIEINGSIEEAFEFFSNMSDKRYKEWHPKDHVIFKWLKGNSVKDGNKAYCEEYIHGKIHKLKINYVKVIQDRYIEYCLSNPIWRFFCPKCSLSFEPVDSKTFRFIAEICYRLGPIAANSQRVKEQLKTVETHQQEEGEYFKALCENNNNLT